MIAQELRIGNLVKDNIDNQTKEVDSTIIKICENDKDVYEPIKLTEEWLLKFGLIKKNMSDDLDCEDLKKPDIDDDGNIWYYWVNGAFNLEIEKNGEIYFEVYSHYIHVEYVHQLQNLYFALTGEELKLK